MKREFVVIGIVGFVLFTCLCIMFPVVTTYIEYLFVIAVAVFLLSCLLEYIGRYR